jgi:hypothetical protein
MGCYKKNARTHASPCAAHSVQEATLEEKHA